MSTSNPANFSPPPHVTRRIYPRRRTGASQPRRADGAHETFVERAGRRARGGVRLECAADVAQARSHLSRVHAVEGGPRFGVGPRGHLRHLRVLRARANLAVAAGAHLEDERREEVRHGAAEHAAVFFGLRIRRGGRVGGFVVVEGRVERRVDGRVGVVVATRVGFLVLGVEEVVEGGVEGGGGSGVVLGGLVEDAEAGAATNGAKVGGDRDGGLPRGGDAGARARAGERARADGDGDARAGFGCDAIGDRRRGCDACDDIGRSGAGRRGSARRRRRLSSRGVG